MAPKPGNTNALKHGLYARHFTPGEVRDLRKMPMDDLRQEIALLRIVVSRMLALAESEPDLEAITKLMNSLSTAVTTLNTTIRTHSLLTGNYSPLDEALAGALDDEPFYKTTSAQAEKK